MDGQKYTTEQLNIPAEGIQLEANCVDFTIYNYGTATLIINDVIPLATGGFYQVAGNKGEIDKTIYRCRFSGAGTTIGVITRRNYK